jgi:hypothetical protein
MRQSEKHWAGSAGWNLHPAARHDVQSVKAVQSVSASGVSVGLGLGLGGMTGTSGGRFRSPVCIGGGGGGSFVRICMLELWMRKLFFQRNQSKVTCNHASEPLPLLMAAHCG